MQEHNARSDLFTITAAVGFAMIIGSVDVPAETTDANIAARVAKMERVLENRGLVDLLQQVERLQQEVQFLRGQIEEQNYTIEQLRNTQRDTYVDIDQRLRGIEGGGAPGGESSVAMESGAPPLTTLTPGMAAPVAGTEPQSSLQMQTTTDAGATGPMTDADTDIDTGPGTGAGTGAAAGPSADGESEPARPVTVLTRPSIVQAGPTIDDAASDEAYRDAFSLLKAGQYDESIVAFTDFLNQFPNSQYADNAQYWLAETYYVKRDFEAALVEYQKLIEIYPASKKQSHAMLKIGYCYNELGQLDQARAVLEDLRSRYPGSTAARLAEERINILAKAQR